MSFLELRTPRDMLEKAKREHARLQAGFDIDHVFNFFVTANHIRDYIEKTDALSRDVLKAFCSDADLRDACDLCDKAKHLRLTHRPDPSTHELSGAIGGAPFAALPIGGDGRWELWSGDRIVDIEYLAARVLAKWEAFFALHGL